MFGDLFGDEEDVNQPSNSTSSKTTKRVYMRKPNEKRSPHGFVGLLNQGATCYLNSLLQLLYMTPELKNKLYSLTLEDLGLEQNDQEKQEGQLKGDIPSLLSIDDNTSNTSTITGGNMDEPGGTSIIANIEKPSNPSIAIKSSQQQQRDRDSKKRQEEEEFDYSILESDYFQNLLSFGFEEHKLIEGLKKFPQEHQQERLVDWILSWDDRLVNDSFSTCGNTHEDASAPAMGPITREQNESLENCTTDILGLKHNDNRSSQSENYDAFFDFLGNSSNNSPQTQAIVLYDENQNKPPFSDLSSTTSTITNSSNQNDSNNTSNNNNNNNSNSNNNKKKKKGRRISYELQRLFSLLQMGNVYSISTENLTKSFGWHDDQSLYQHDIHELNRILFDAVEHSIKNTAIENVFNELYKGSFRNRIECGKCDTCKDIEEFYLDLPVSVKGSNSVNDSLNSFIKPEILDGKNMYFCEKCNEKVKATYTQRIDKLPPVLHMHLNRFDYDLQNGKRVKINNRFEFPNTIDLLPYTTEYSNYEKSLASLKIDNPDLTEKEISKILPKPKEKVYELFAVLIHSGGAFGGHYHSYIKDLLNLGKSFGEDESNGKDKDKDTLDEKDKESQFNHDKYTNWFDFNDSSVLPIKDKNIIQQFGGRSECAYMLIYRDREYNQAIESSEIPVHFEKEVMEFNLNLEKQRNTYEKTINTMFLYPKFQEDFILKEGFLYENQQPKDAIQELESDHLVLQIDVASTVDDLFSIIDQKYPDQIRKLGGSGNYVIQEITIRDGKVTSIQPQIQPNSQLNIKRTGLHEASQFIIWKGEDQSGLPIKPIHYSIKFFKDNSYKLFNLAISKDSSFPQLQKQIGELLDISHDKVLIYSSTQQSVILLEDEINIPLSNRIYNGLCLLVEEKSSESFSMDKDSLVYKDFELNKNKIQIFVKDNFYLERKNPILLEKNAGPGKIFIDPKSTIYDLKSLIFENIRLDLNRDDWIGKAIIRKTTVGGYEGTAITDDSTLLKDANIIDSSLIIFEPGTPTKSSISIRYLYFKDKVNVFESSGSNEIHSTVSVSKTTTLLNLKKEILKKLFVSEELVGRYVIRACDLFEKPIHIITDEDQSLEESGITSNDVIAIEEGILPTKDQTPLQFRYYQSSRESILLQFPSSPILHLNPTYIPPIPDLYTIHNLGTCLVDRKQTLSSLKNQILKWDNFINSKDPIINFNTETDDIRFWIDERLLSTLNKPLAKLHIHPESTLTIEIFKKHENSQIINEDQQEQTNNHNQEKQLPPILLYTHKRKPTEQCFEHPSKQLVFNGKLISELTSQISKEYEIEEKYIKLFKYLPNQKVNPWKVIEERSTNSPAMNGKSLDSILAPIQTSVDRPQFGIPIEKLVQRQSDDGVEVNHMHEDLPLILIRFIETLLLLDGTDHNNIFSDQDVDLELIVKIREILDKSTPDYIAEIKDVKLIGSLFKQWLREIPVSLIPESLLNDLVNSSGDKVYDIIREKAPPLHTRSLDFILDFLMAFFEPDAISKSSMSPFQIATDLSPVLLRTINNNDNRNVKVIESLINRRYNELVKKVILADNVNGDIDISKTIGNFQSENNNNNSLPPPPPPIIKKKPAANLKNNELRGKPYLLKDGDIISFVDIRDDPEGLDKFAMSSNKFNNFSTRYSKEGSGEKYSIYGSNKSTYKPREVSLTIELDDY